MPNDAKVAASPALPILLMVLSAVTGLIDAVSILGMGRVFTANMTGNIVFLGFAVGGAAGFEPLRYIAALAAFLLGALLGGRLGRPFNGGPRRSWLMWSAGLETALFWAAAAAAHGYDLEAQQPTTSLYALIILTAVAMGLRNATVRQLKVPDMTTTVLTLTLTGLAADSHLAGGNNPNWRRRAGSILAVFVGACIGAALIVRTGLFVPLVLTGATVLLATLAYVLHPASAAVPRTI